MLETVAAGRPRTEGTNERRVADRRVKSAMKQGEARSTAPTRSQAASLNERLRRAAKVAFSDFGED